MHVMQHISFELNVKPSGILIDRLGTVILSALLIKRQVLVERLRTHLMVPG